jgi:hypothetical protein
MHNALRKYETHFYKKGRSIGMISGVQQFRLGSISKDLLLHT